VTDTNVFQLSQPGTFVYPLTEVLRNGARALLARTPRAAITPPRRRRVQRNSRRRRQMLTPVAGPVCGSAPKRFGPILGQAILFSSCCGYSVPYL
jgi:hypothetical protein